MSNFNWGNYQFIDYLNVKKHEVNNLPKGVIISTMCASCKDGLGTNINIDNILKYMPLNNNDIISVKRNWLFLSSSTNSFTSGFCVPFFNNLLINTRDMFR